MSLSSRVEYLTLAVGNAKSHPVSAGGRHETAIAFLTELEEKLDVAQVQLELQAALHPRINEPGEIGAKIQMLSKTLLTITEVSAVMVWCGCSRSLINIYDPQLWASYAEPFDLPIMKLLIFHVSGHKDESMIRPVWYKIFDDSTE